jgi:hypothetical protein
MIIGGYRAAISGRASMGANGHRLLGDLAGRSNCTILFWASPSVRTLKLASILV